MCVCVCVCVCVSVCEPIGQCVLFACVWACVLECLCACPCIVCVCVCVCVYLVCLSVTLRSYIIPPKRKALASLQHALFQQRTAAGRMSLSYLTLHSFFLRFLLSLALSLSLSLLLLVDVSVSPGLLLKELSQKHYTGTRFCSSAVSSRFSYSSCNVLVSVFVSCECLHVSQPATCSACHVLRGNEDGLD